MMLIRSLLTALILTILSTPVWSEDFPYRLIVISVMIKPIYLLEDGREVERNLFEGITQLETSNLGGGTFRTKEECVDFLRSLVRQRGGETRGYKMLQSPFHYQEIMVERTGDGYHTERHCIFNG